MSESTVSDLMGMIRAPFQDAQGTCDIHGDYTATVLIINGQPREPECTECLQQRIREERVAEATRIATERESKCKQSRIDGIELPRRMMAKRWSDYEPANAKAGQYLAACRKYADEWPRNYEIGAGLIMTGSTGCGKTHLASVLCKQVASQHNVRPLYTTVSTMLRYIRATFNKGCTYTEAQALERYTSAELLVIDEVGVKLSSEFDKSTLFEIIDVRYQDEIPTVLISNLSVKEINEHIDARLVDRLSEHGQLMVFDWNSHRGSAS